MSRRVPGPLFVLRGHKGQVQALAFHPEIDVLYSGDSEGDAIGWDLGTRRQIMHKRVHPPTAGVLALAVAAHRGDTLLLSQGRDGTICVWKLDDRGLLIGDALFVLNTGSYNFCRMSVLTSAADDGILVACCGADPATVNVWDITAMKRLATFQQPAKWGMCMAVSVAPGSKPEHPLRCLTGYEDGTLALWQWSREGETTPPPQTLKVHGESVMAVAFNSQGTGVVSGAADSHAALINTTPELALVANCSLSRPGVADVAIRQDCRMFVTGGWDGKVRAFRCVSSSGGEAGKPVKHPAGSLIAVLDYHQAGVDVAAFRPRDFWLATGSKDQTLAVWTMFAKDTRADVYKSGGGAS